MAMGEARSGLETRQVEMVALDDLVPADDLYRRVEAQVSWPAVRATAAPFYAEGGRPSICPAVLMKLFLVCALEGHGSMRATLGHASRDLSIRRFLGYGLSERLPHHSTLSFAQCVRFAESSLFEQLFTQVLAGCRQAGLVEGSRLVVDATHVEADAALKGLRAELRALADQAGPEGPPEAGEPAPAGAPSPAPPGPPALALAPARSGPTPARRATNATVRSASDPDARLRHKPGQRPHLVHRAQVATDPKARCIVAVRAESAGGHEGDSLALLIARARWAGHAAREVCADSGYASASVYAALAEARALAFIPPQPSMAHTAHGRLARRRCQSPVGASAAIDRQAHAEGAIAELKLRHALGRARCRGTPKLQVQLLVAATAVNLKRLAAPRPPAPGAQEAGGQAEQAGGSLVWCYEVCLN